MFCPHKHIFGKEREGFHALRMFDLAVWDVVGTVVIAWALAVWFGWGIGWTILAAFALAIVLHRLFCVNTTINMMIFGRV